MKIRALILLLCITCVFLTSCGGISFESSLSCKELSSALTEEISPSDEFSEYSAEDLSFFSIDRELCMDFSMVYSKSSEDISEVGVFKAKDEQSARELFTELKGHIVSVREEKADFLKNYLPDEVSKLDGADVKQMGNYLILSILDAKSTSKVFQYAKELLTK